VVGAKTPHVASRLTVADQDIDLAALDGRLPAVRVERPELDRLRIAQHGGRDGAAEVDVEADVVPIGVEEAESGESVVYAADQRASLLDLGQPALARSGRLLGLLRRLGLRSGAAGGLVRVLAGLRGLAAGRHGQREH
jgi:hypothetical protein